MQPEQNSPKILIIRLSSFGDIIQAMSVLRPLRERFPTAKIDWLVRSDNQSALAPSPELGQIWAFDRRDGLKGLISLALKLRRESYTHVYDAHSNLRSRLVCTFLWPTFFARRSKERFKRLLLFKFRLNKFPWPYQGMKSFLAPLRPWGVEGTDLTQTWNFGPKVKEKVDALLGGEDFVALVPSAAWEMKRWPLSQWKQLISISRHRFVLLGGPADTFLSELKDVAPERVMNLAGKLSLAESCYAITKARAVISADTGLLHVADLLGVPGIALIGPTAFGFPTHSHIKILDVDLPCRPCTKDGSGKCTQDVYQKCLVNIGATRVARELEQLIKN